MPCRYVIAMNGDVVVELWTGVVTAEELAAHKQQQFGDPAINPGASVLSDCTRAEFAISAEGVDSLSDMDKDSGGQPAISRYAFLVNYDVYDKAQHFADRVNQYGKSVIVFNTLDLAAKWLGMEARGVRDLLQRLADRPD